MSRISAYTLNMNYMQYINILIQLQRAFCLLRGLKQETSFASTRHFSESIQYRTLDRGIL